MGRSHLNIMAAIQRIYPDATRILVSSLIAAGVYHVYIQLPDRATKTILDSDGIFRAFGRSVTSISQDIESLLHLEWSVYDLETIDRMPNPEFRYRMTSATFTDWVIP